jgi:3-mercaptopyruvate sulfurtransferase SseA
MQQDDAVLLCAMVWFALHVSAAFRVKQLNNNWAKWF